MPAKLSENQPTLKWKRPDSIDYPKVWYTFKARDIDSDNLVEYRIQDLPLDRVNDLLNYLKNSFITEEALRQALGYKDDPHANDDHMQYMKPVIAQRLTLVCFKEGSDEIVGAHIVYIKSKDDTYLLDIRKAFKGHLVLSLFDFIDILLENWNAFKRFDVDQYMSSMGLSVDRKYRGRGVGTHFLKSRFAVCREFGITLIQNLFATESSNACADRAGYNIDMVWSYADIAENYPQFEKIANTKSKQMTLRSYIL